jgi:sugar phosphate isomerase/epimerase
MSPTITGIGASVSPTGDLASLDALLARLHEDGCEVAELNAAALHVTIGGANNRHRLAAVAAICSAYPLGYSVHAPIAINFMDPANDAHHRAVLASTIALAAAIGASLIVLHPGRVAPDRDRADRTRLLARERDAIRHFADQAGRDGIRLAMENLNPDRSMIAGHLTSYALDPRALADQIATIDHPRVCGTLDFGHGWLASAHLGFDYAAGLRAFAPVVNHLHVTDNCGRPLSIQHAADHDFVAFGMGDLHLPIGWGSVPYADLLTDLPIRPGTRMIAEVKSGYGDHRAGDLAAMRSFRDRLHAQDQVHGAAPSARG